MLKRVLLLLLLIASISFVVASSIPPIIETNPSYIELGNNTSIYLDNNEDSEISILQFKVWKDEKVIYGSGPINKTIQPGQRALVFEWDQRGNSGDYDDKYVEKGIYFIEIKYSLGKEAKSIRKEIVIHSANGNECFDLDGGNNPGTPSRVIYYTDKKEYILTDTCRDSNYLYEAVCDGDKGKSVGQKCSQCYIDDGFGFCSDKENSSEISGLPPVIEFSPSTINVGDNISIYLENTKDQELSIVQVLALDKERNIIYGSGPIDKIIQSDQREFIFEWNQKGNSGNYNGRPVGSDTYFIKIVYFLGDSLKTDSISKELIIHGSEIKECFDLDGGDNITEPSKVIYFNNGQRNILQDFCDSDLGLLYEAVCDDNKLGRSVTHECSCSSLDALGYCSNGTILKNNETQIEKYGELSVSAKCEFGCYSEGNCYPLGFRKDDLYCSGDKQLVSQKASGTVCENNFECNTNLCIGSECINSNLWQKILDFFKKLFGSA